MSERRSRTTINKHKNKIVYGNNLWKIFTTLVMASYDPYIRIDSENKVITFELQGKRCDGGWEVDHIIAQTNGGSNHITNLQPLNWYSNLKKSNTENYFKKDIHYFWKRTHVKGFYNEGYSSFREIEVDHGYLIYANSKIKHTASGVVKEKHLHGKEKYILVEFTRGEGVKVPAYSCLFSPLGKRKRSH